MIPFGQHSAPDFIQKAIGIKNTVIGVKDGLETAVEAIGELAKIILNCIDWTKAIIKHPIIALTFIDKVSMIVLMVLFILKILGFEELDRYIWLSALIKINPFGFEKVYKKHNIEYQVNLRTKEITYNSVDYAMKK